MLLFLVLFNCVSSKLTQWSISVGCLWIQVDTEDKEFEEEFLSQEDPSMLHFLLASGEEVLIASFKILPKDYHSSRRLRSAKIVIESEGNIFHLNGFLGLFLIVLGATVPDWLFN